MTPAKLIALMGRAPLGGVTTWNSADKGAGVTLSGGDLVMSVAGATPNMVRSTTSKAVDTGKFYAEMVAGAADDCWIGFAVAAASLTNYLGSDVSGIGYASNGNIYVGGIVESTETAYGAGATIGLAIDTASAVKKFWWAMNGTWQNGDPAAGTGGRVYSTSPSFLAASAADGASIRLNCGQQAFDVFPPTGFSAWG